MGANLENSWMPASDLTSDPLLEKAPVREGYKVLGGVVLYQKLGQGGMGAVYRGKHLRLEVDVALKVMAAPAGIHPDQAANYRQRFLREAKTAASVRHSNLIRVYDVNAEGGVHFLIMDYIDGESAGDRLKRKGKLDEQEAVEIALGAAEGLAAAHRTGIVHRDVKPDNILIDKQGDVVVADLGLAKAYGAGESDSAMSMGLSLTQQAMGTPYYMAPEQTMSAKDVGPAADVWSLGVTLYQLATDSLPWSDSDIVNLMVRIRAEAVPDARRACPGLSGGLCAIIEKALKKAPAERYADCGEMTKALRRHLASIVADAGESVLADEAAGTTKLALVSVTPPVAQTMTLIAAAALKDAAVSDVRLEPRAAVTPPTATVGEVGVDDVIDKRMEVETLLADFEREFPDADAAELKAIRRELQIAKEAAGTDPAAAMRRVERAAERLAGLRTSAQEGKAEEDRLAREAREAEAEREAEGRRAAEGLRAQEASRAEEARQTTGNRKLGTARAVEQQGDQTGDRGGFAARRFAVDNLTPIIVGAFLALVVFKVFIPYMLPGWLPIPPGFGRMSEEKQAAWEKKRKAREQGFLRQVRVKLTERGFMPPLCTWLLFWQLSYLAQRYLLRVRRDGKALSADLLPQGSGKLTGREIEGIAQRVASAAPYGKTLLAERIRHAITEYKANQDKARVSDLLRQRAGLDSRHGVRAYVVPGVLALAIPVLGFIGTYLGLRWATRAMREALHDGVGPNPDTLFRMSLDPTLVALVMCAVALLALILVRRRELRLLTDIDSYVESRLVKRV